MVLRRLLGAPGFVAIAILTLAIGIGANTAIFSIVDGVLLRPLSFPQPQRLILLTQSIPQFAQKYPEFPVNARFFRAWQQLSKTLDSLALMQPDNWVLTGAGQPQQVSGADITAGMFSTLGVRPSLGRDFNANDDRPGKTHVIILSYGYWRSQFHGDPGVVGRIIDLDGAPNQIVGVMPASLQYPNTISLLSFFGGNAVKPILLFRPLGIDYAKAQPLGNFNYVCFARMKPGVTPEQVRAELNVIGAGFLASVRSQLPAQVGNVQVLTRVTSLRDAVVGSHALGLWLLLAAVAAILAIVCLNLANLLLVRVHGRGHELAIRLALGAGRGRLIRETVGEGLVLALVGGALGVAAAFGALRWLVHVAPAGIPRIQEIGINFTVLLFSLTVAIACGVLFSLWPAWRGSRTDPQSALRSGGRSASDTGERMRVRSWLVGGQAALAALLLIVAGLLTASYVSLLGVNKGFQTSQVIEAEINWPGKREQRAAFYHDVLGKVQALPGVRIAGLIDTIPTQGVNDTDLISYVHDPRPLVERPLAAFSSISPDYFAAMGIPILRGRTFTDAEMARALVPVPKGATPPSIAAVISQTTADKMFPGKDPIGQQFMRSDPSEAPFTIVGVVADVRATGLEKAPGLAAYLPYTYNIPGSVALTLRTNDPLNLISGQVRQAVWSVRPDAAIPTIATMNSIVDDSVASRRFQLTLVLLFAGCAMFLAALGIYGVVAYSVERRTGEISLRMTLGAQSGDLMNMIMRQGLTPVVIGLVAGVAAALGAGKFVASLLFGVHASDPSVIVTVSLILLTVAALACVLPAMRATRTDPAAVLRQ